MTHPVRAALVHPRSLRSASSLHRLDPVRESLGMRPFSLSFEATVRPPAQGWLKDRGSGCRCLPMDFLGDLLAALFTPAGPRRGASRVERIIAVVAFVGLVLLVAFIWLVYSGF
jgi:hypothetical protein